jgi:CBS domain-containing protein
MIRAALKQLNLITVPDFEIPHIDAPISLKDVSAASLHPVEIPPTTTTTTPPPDPLEATKQAAEVAGEAKRIEPAHQISRLRSANTPPEWVNPNASIKEAITIMLANDFSQVPVMQSEREPRGIFSWKSLGARLSLEKKCEYVRECMDEYKELGPEASLYDAIPLIVRHDCVLIRDETKKISGIVTPADLSIQFQALAEPFLLVGAIENQLRGWIAARFQKIELQAAKDPDDTDRRIEDVSDLTFGEYVRLLENPPNWARLQTAIDRKIFVEKLSKVRDIRNDVMHFDPDPMDPSDLEFLRNFAQLLDRLEKLGAW